MEVPVVRLEFVVFSAFPGRSAAISVNGYQFKDFVWYKWG